MAFVGDDLPTLMRAKAPRAGQEKAMRFYFNTEPFTGMTDAISIQAIGLYGDDRFVIEADTEEEATQKFLDLLEKRVYEGQVRPATEDEGKEFEEAQGEARRIAKFTDELVEKFKKDREGVANGQAK
jgi:hypothetical protein